MRKSGSTTIIKSTAQTCFSTHREHATVNSNIVLLVAAFESALLRSFVQQQVRGIVGTMTPSSTANSTELLIIAEASRSEGVNVSTAMECVVLSHSHICSFVEHEKYPTKPLDPTPRDVLNVDSSVNPFAVPVTNVLHQFLVVGCPAIDGVAFSSCGMLRF